MAKGFGVMCCVYDDATWLPLMVDGCYTAVDKVFFLVSRRPWNGELERNDKTIEAIRSCRDSDNKLFIVEGDWPTEADQRNAGLNVCRDTGLQFCAVIDADEVYDPVSLELMFQIARLQIAYDVWSISQIIYWKSYRHVIESQGHNGQSAIVRIGQTRFTWARQTSAHHIARLPARLGVCHHMSYARTDEEIMKKLSHFSHANQVRPNWIDEVWRRWDREPSLRNLHPLKPEVFPRAVRQRPENYPPALRRIYDSDLKMK